VDHPRDPLLDAVIALREEMAETRATVRQLSADVAEMRLDTRRLDGRIDQVFLVQIATLLTALGSLGTSVVALLAA
jgi:hypothetical protein